MAWPLISIVSSIHLIALSFVRRARASVVCFIATAAATTASLICIIIAHMTEKQKQQHVVSVHVFAIKAMWALSGHHPMLLAKLQALPPYYTRTTKLMTSQLCYFDVLCL